MAHEREMSTPPTFPRSMALLYLYLLILWHIKTFAVYYMAVCNNIDWKQYSDFR